MPDSDPSSEPRRDPPPASLLQVVSAVSWSFFGVRKRAAMSKDVVNIKPLHVVVVGVLLAAVMVLALVALVQFITRAS